MSMRGLGSLANLAKILEAASNPESDLREDRQKPKKVLHGKRVSAKKAVDPKRKAWHERRLKELNKKAPSQASDSAKPSTPAVPTADPKAAKAVAAGLSGSLISALAAAKPGAAKPDSQNKRQEAWKRKPGDPVF